MIRSVPVFATLALFATTIAAQTPVEASSQSERPVAPTAGPASWDYGPYTYDAAGNITGIRNQSYTYDPMSRLVKGSAAIAPAQQSLQTHVYSYDVYRNLLTAGVEGAPTQFSVSSTTNRLTTLTYDAAGNVTVWQPSGSAYAREYLYDELNMIVREKITGSTDVTYHIYTADDERYGAATR